MVKLKAIESREHTFCYLLSYLHCSFFWHLVIVTSIVSSDYWAEAKTFGHTKNVWSYQEHLLVLLRYLIVRKLLSGCGEILELVVVLLLLLCLYPNAVYQCYLINPSKVWAAQDVILSSWWIIHLHPAIHQDPSA